MTQKIEQIMWMKPDELIPYEMNAKMHPASQVEHIANSIKAFGWTQPIVVDENNVVVIGHGRLMAAKELHLEKVPVVRRDDLTEKQINACRLADNKTNESEWDFAKLEQELADLDIAGIDMSYFGFEVGEDFEDHNREIVEDEVPEVQEEAVSKLGQIYQLGRHRLMCGDSTDQETVKALIGGAVVDMVFTDPPYGINLDGDNSKRGSETSLMKGGLKLKSFVDDSIIYAEKAFDIVQTLGVKTQVWFGGNYYCHHLPQTNNWLIWDKRVEEKMNNTNSDAELAWVLDGHQSCRIFRHLWNGLIKASEKGQRRVHPTQKPIALVQWCINKYNPECRTLLDLFGGSGTSLMACEQMGRTCLMMELDPHYVDVIIKRWENFTGEKAVLLSE